MSTAPGHYHIPPPHPQQPNNGDRIPRGVWIAIVAVVCVFALVLGTALVAATIFTRADPPAAKAPVEPPAGPKGLKRYYQQKLIWSGCGAHECTTFLVPLDYDKPNDRAIEISVLRNGSGKRNAQNVVVNPGGPGGSGKEYAASGKDSFGRNLTKSVNIVGFDPRGVNDSTPLDCLDARGLDEVIASDPDPDTPKEERAASELLTKFGEACLDNDPDLAKHVSTVEAAKDMDILRALLGDKKMDYFGASYGTFLGATYAELFPKKVGRFVLDGAIDPAQSDAEMTYDQLVGFQTALEAYLGYCVGSGSCPLGSTVPAAEQKLAEFFQGLDQKPLQTSKGRKLTQGWAAPGLFLPLYRKDFWPYLNSALNEAINSGDGTELMTLAEAYVGRGSYGYDDNSYNALLAVNCLDHGEGIPFSKVKKQEKRFTDASPVFGSVFATGLAGCSGWPIKTKDSTKAIKAKGAPPIVVLGTSRDPATPLKWAEAMARQLESGVLIRRDGDGHTAFQMGNNCVDDAVEGFLIDGKVPQDGLSC